MSLPDDPEARIEHIRGILHRFHGIDEIVARIPGVEIRNRIRELEGGEIPGASQLVMSRDDHFAKMLVMIRHGYDRTADYHAALTRLATILDQAMSLSGAPQGATPQSTTPKSATTQGATPQGATPERDPPAPGRPGPGSSPASPPVPLRVQTSPGQKADGPVPDGDADRPAAQRPGDEASDPLRIFAGRPESEVIALAALLPPPPPQGCPDSALLTWISGSPWSPRALGLSYAPDALRRLPAGADDILTEMEIDLHANPTGFLSEHGARPRIIADAYPGLGDWLVRQASQDGSVFGDPHARALRAAFESIVDLFAPTHAGQLATIHAALRPGPELALGIALAIDLECAFLSDVDPDDEPPSRQIPNGSIHPERRLEPGIVLRSALAAHLLAGHPLDAALAVSLLELRQAQVLRACGGFMAAMPCDDFDSRFLDDCRSPVDAYMMDPEPTPEMC